jgi:hypothetical protein
LTEAWDSFFFHPYRSTIENETEENKHIYKKSSLQSMKIIQMNVLNKSQLFVTSLLFALDTSNAHNAWMHARQHSTKDHNG